MNSLEINLRGNITLLALATAFLSSCGQQDSWLTPSSIRERLSEVMMSGDQYVSPLAVFKPIEASDWTNAEIDLRFNVLEAIGDDRFEVVPSGFANEDIRTYSFVFNGIPLCHSQAKVFRKSEGNQKNLGNFAMLAHFPKIEHIEFVDRVVDLNDANAMIRGQFAALGFAHDNDISQLSERNCLIQDESKLIQGKEIVLVNGDYQYKALVSAERVYELDPMFFDATGSAKSYSTNPTTGSLKTFALTGLASSGSLENDYFVTSTTGSPAQSSTFNFDFDPTDGRFDETSLFVHANEQLEWFLAHGRGWPGSDKLTLYVHAVVGGSVNNALYTPGSSGTPPKIQVGDGDGIRLKNLPKDADVVAHELGHHMIYDTLKSVKGESLVIHEGLADYFAFARAGDACLGESICPANSPIGCETPLKCLRTAENGYVLEKNTKSEAHFKSQFLSGWMWDLRNKMDAATFDKIAIKGVSLLLEESGYHDLVLAIARADDAITDGKNCNTIYDSAVERGMGSYIDDFNCKDGLPAMDGTSNATTSTSSSDSSKKKKGGILGACSVIGGHEDADIKLTWTEWTFQMMVVLTFFGVPMIPHVRRRRST